MVLEYFGVVQFSEPKSSRIVDSCFGAKSRNRGHRLEKA